MIVFIKTIIIFFKRFFSVDCLRQLEDKMQLNSLHYYYVVCVCIHCIVVIYN